MDIDTRAVLYLGPGRDSHAVRSSVSDYEPMEAIQPTRSLGRDGYAALLCQGSEGELSRRSDCLRSLPRHGYGWRSGR